MLFLMLASFPVYALKLNYQSAELLIAIKGNPQDLPQEVLEVCEGYGIEKIKKLKLPGVFKVTLAQGSDLEEAKEKLEKLESVKYVEYNYILKVKGTLVLGKSTALTIENGIIPNDPDFEKQWGIKKIDAPQAWDITTGDENIKIAIIDTGCDLTHEDLKQRIDKKHSKNILNPTQTVQDDHVEGHGTHVVGIIAAMTDNEKGISGISWKGKVVIIKALDKNGEADIDILADAIVEAADIEGVKIINMSWGGPYFSTTLHEAVKYAYNKGITLIAAAGNDGKATRNIPAAYKEVIGVTATKENDSPCYSFTNYNPLDVEYYQIAAPGRYIYSTLPTNKGKYGYMDGTSMAAAHVAGSIALLLSQNPELTPEKIESLLTETADEIKNEDPGRDIGKGRINIYNAIQKLDNSFPKKVKAVAWVGERGKKEIQVEKGEIIKFFADESKGIEGKPLNYLWDFKDGTNSTKANPTHIYHSEGIYEPTLSVFIESQIDSDQVKVIVGNKPIPTPTPKPTPTPIEEATIYGEVISAVKGEALEGARIIAFSSNSKLPETETTTDINGTYRLSLRFENGETSKSYRIVARKSGYEPDEKNIVISPGDVKELNFTLKPKKQTPKNPPADGSRGGGCGASAQVNINL